MTSKKNDTSEEQQINKEEVLKAFEKLFAGGRQKGVRRFQQSGVRHIKLAGGAELIEQNPHKESEWAAKARQGQKIAWVMKDGDYLARVVNGEVEVLHHSSHD
jgi:hypothetical protein